MILSYLLVTKLIQFIKNVNTGLFCQASESRAGLTDIAVYIGTWFIAQKKYYKHSTAPGEI